MTNADQTTVDALWRVSALRQTPAPPAAERRAGLILLRELTRGSPVAVDDFARALGAQADTAERLVSASTLSPFILRDEDGLIGGFMGMSVTETPHRMTVGDQLLWTWCAYDTLFLPALIGRTVRVESHDPAGGQAIRLTVSPQRIETADPVAPLVSMVRPEAWDLTSATCAIASVCQHGFFHVSRETGEQWRSRRRQTILLSVEEAFEFGKRSNTHRFGGKRSIAK